MAKRGAKREKRATKKPIESYDHQDKKRANNPPVGLVTPQTDPERGAKKTYQYDPHLDPQLVWAGKAEHFGHIVRFVPIRPEDNGIGSASPDPQEPRKGGEPTMNEPTIICPTCKSEIKLTESLAAPIVEATRRQYEQKIAQKEAEVTKREEALRDQRATSEKPMRARPQWCRDQAPATDLFDSGINPDDVQNLTGHADPRTTRLYDRRKREVTRNIVERISS